MQTAKATKTLPVAAPGFRYDTSQVKWKDFLTEGCYYRLLHVDVAAKTAEMLVKFEPNCQCLYHRHRAVVSTLVLEGEQHLYDQTPHGEVLKIKPAGSFSVGGMDEVHIEGGGAEGTVLFFSMRTDSDVIYEILDKNLRLKRSITVADFDHDWRENWPEDQAAAKPGASAA